MEFKTIQEAFNHWNGKSLNEIEKRAQEVKGMIETDPDVNITALNIELTGLAEAKANAPKERKPRAPMTEEQKIKMDEGRLAKLQAKLAALRANNANVDAE